MCLIIIIRIGGEERGKEGMTLSVSVILSCKVYMLISNCEYFGLLEVVMSMAIMRD